MKRNGRLALALHTLSHMASDPACVQTSAEIAAHAGTNPVVVRRVLGRLREAGLMASEKGHAGGWRLTRSPDDITLADVYLALGESLLTTASGTVSGHCNVERALHQKVASVMDELETSLIAQLRATTIADIHDSKLAR